MELRLMSFKQQTICRLKDLEKGQKMRENINSKVILFGNVWEKVKFFVRTNNGDTIGFGGSTILVDWAD